MNLGFMVVSGVRLPITSIVPVSGKIVFTAETVGPLHIPPGPVTIFGIDGMGVCQSSTLLPNPLDVGAGTGLSLSYAVRVDYVRPPSPTLSARPT